MSPNKLPKAVRATINRLAFEIATTDVYASIKRDMEQRALLLMSQPHASIGEVIAVLDSNHCEHTYALIDSARPG